MIIVVGVGWVHQDNHDYNPTEDDLALSNLVYVSGRRAIDGV